MSAVKYRSLQGYKFQLTENFEIQLSGVFHLSEIDTEFIQLSKSGFLTIKKGYAWDGASGTPFQTDSFMRGALVHDALYQLMREKYLDYKEHRLWADEILVKLCEEDGMSDFRAWYVFKSVRLIGEKFAKPPEVQVESGNYRESRNK